MCVNGKREIYTTVRHVQRALTASNFGTMSWRARIGRNIRELKIICGPENAVNKGTRQFVLKNYNEVKDLNPYFPFLVREFDEVEPMFMARYDWGKEEVVKLKGLSCVEVEDKLKELVLKGDTMRRSPESDSWLMQPSAKWDDRDHETLLTYLRHSYCEGEDMSFNTEETA